MRSSRVSQRRSSRLERDRPLWTGGHAQAAFVALIGARDVCGHTPVGDALELSEAAKTREVVGIHPADVEDVVRTDAHAVALGLATPMVDDGDRRRFAHDPKNTKDPSYNAL